MQISKYSLVIGLIGFLFSGCAGRNSMPEVDNTEAFKYIKKYETEYEQIKRDFKDKTIIKWIQPFNKKEKCEVEVNLGKNDKTLDKNYRLFWDGECKNGKADGLGRIFEISDVYEQSLLSIYSSGKISNVCFIEREYENTTLMGECRGNELDLDFDFSKLNIDEFGINNGTKNNFQKIKELNIQSQNNPTYNVVTKIYDDLNQFHIEQKYGTYGNIDTPIMIMQFSPFSSENEYQKLYPNYGYLLSENFFGTFNDKDERHGHLLQGETFGVEYINNRYLRSLFYPNSLTQFYRDEYYSVKNSVERANNAYTKANIIKEKYKNKICRDNVKVDFMDNNEYKTICNEDKKFVELKKKIDEKIVQLVQRKQDKIEQRNQQRLIESRESEAQSAQKSVEELKKARVQQSLQNLNNNLQMQQLNNNLMMNNLMPKKYNIYVH